MNGYCNGRQIEGPRGVSRDACWQYCTVVEGDPYAEHNPNTDTYTDIGSGCWCHASCTGIIVYNDFTPRRSATVIMGPCGMTVPPPTTGATPATWPYSSQPCNLPPSPPPPPPKLATNVMCLPIRSDEALLDFSGAKPQRFLHCSPPSG